MASREPGDDAVTPAPGGEDFYLYGHSVVMVHLNQAANPPNP